MDKTTSLQDENKIVDIGGNNLPVILRASLNKELFWADGKTHHQRWLPSTMLGDDTGLHLWSQITRLPDYYQTTDEIELLDLYGAEITSHISAGTTIIDLGAG